MENPEPSADFPECLTFGPKEVIVVTGGSGFLGQHIIRVIQERAEGVKEIRVVDVLPYEKKLEYADKFPIVYFKGDISIENELDRPFSGATCVIHAAGIVDVGHYVDRNEMLSVNVNGTSNILLKCRQWNIPTLVVTSTVDVIIQSNSKFIDQRESDTELLSEEKAILVGYYGFTKAQSEMKIRTSRTLPLANGNRLRTAILRPTALYGELDSYFVPIAMKVAKSCWGYLVKPKICSEEPILQATYAGNAAWAHVLAAWHLNQEAATQGSTKESEIDGETFYVTDDTTPGTIYDFMKPFLGVKGYKTVNSPIPLFLILFFLKWMSWMVEIVFPISWKKCLNEYPVFPRYEAFLMAHLKIHFSRQKLTECLKYQPIYTEEDARTNSAKYYKELAI